MSRPTPEEAEGRRVAPKNQMGQDICSIKVKMGNVWSWFLEDEQFIFN
jgi:hypothetical protein